MGRALKISPMHWSEQCIEGKDGHIPAITRTTQIAKMTSLTIAILTKRSAVECFQCWKISNIIHGSTLFAFFTKHCLNIGQYPIRSTNRKALVPKYRHQLVMYLYRAT